MSDIAEELLRRYVALTIEWADLPSAKFRKANKIFKAAHVIAKQLRETQDGRAGLLSLLSHANLSVRLGAATESLPFDPDAALAVIDHLAGSDTAQAFEASMVAQEWRAGRLNPDW